MIEVKAKNNQINLVMNGSRIELLMEAALIVRGIYDDFELNAPGLEKIFYGLCHEVLNDKDTVAVLFRPLPMPTAMHQSNISKSS